MFSAVWGVAIPEGEALSKRHMLLSGTRILHEDHDSGVLGHAVKEAHDQSILLWPQVWLQAVKTACP